MASFWSKSYGATLNDRREAVNELENTNQIARRVLGDAHPIAIGSGSHLRNLREDLRAREAPGS